MQNKTTETSPKSLEEIWPLSKAQSRESIKKVCKPGRLRVLRGMPEKNEIQAS
jgi:hypothetical protein